MTIALGKTRDMQGNPFKKPRFIKKQADDDNGDKSKGGIPILPVAGDIAIGAEALPYLEYLGNMFNNTEDNTNDKLHYICLPMVFPKWQPVH